MNIDIKKANAVLDLKLLDTLEKSSVVHRKIKTKEEKDKISKREKIKYELDFLEMIVTLYSQNFVKEQLESFLPIEYIQVLELASAAKATNKSSNKKSNKLKEGLLYKPSSSKVKDEQFYGDDENDIEVLDPKKLQSEIRDLHLEIDKVKKEHKKIQQFVNGTDNSHYIHYIYLASKLKSARDLISSQKTNSLSGDYLSRTLLLRKELLEKMNKNSIDIQHSLDRIHKISTQLNEESLDFAKQLKEIDNNKNTSLKINDQETNPSPKKLIESPYPKLQNRLDESDEKKIIKYDQSFIKIIDYYKSISNEIASNAKKMKDLEVLEYPKVSSEKSEVSVTNTESLAVKNDTKSKEMIKLTSSQLSSFLNEVEGHMESCWNMSINKLKQREASRYALLKDFNERADNSNLSILTTKLNEVYQDLDSKEETFQTMKEVTSTLRDDILQTHEAELKSILAQRSNIRLHFVNNLKAHYNTLYSQAQIKAQKK